jgi:addiction module RelB/DinJ family antitoxin
LKKRIQSIFSDIGLDLSSGIHVYLHQVDLTGGIPFPLTTDRRLTPKHESELMEDIEYALTSEKEYDSVEEMVEDIMSEDHEADV